MPGVLNFLQGIFHRYFHMCLTASLVILVVLVLRLLLKDIPKNLMCVLWLAVLFRLLSPVTVAGPLPRLWPSFPLESGEEVQPRPIVTADRTHMADMEGLPAGAREYDLILKHEGAHIRRGDCLLKYLSWIALSIHWWNPLARISAKLLQKDMEMACDEYVVAHSGEDVRKEYATVLLRFSMAQSGMTFPVAFGESSTERRVGNILRASGGLGLLCHGSFHRNSNKLSHLSGLRGAGRKNLCKRQ